MADTRPPRAPCRCAYCLGLDKAAGAPPPPRTPEDGQAVTTPESVAPPISTRKPGR